MNSALNRSYISRSLSVQLLAAVFLSQLISLLSFGLFFSLGNSLLDHTIYGQNFSHTMSDLQFKNLQRYVRDENITAENVGMISAWLVRREGIYITIYQDSIRIYESLSPGETLPPGELITTDSHRYELDFSDGTQAQAYIYYFASEAFFYWMTIVSGVLAFLVLSICLVLLVHVKLRYFTRLKNELEVMAGGDLTHPVTIEGHDELSEIASGIDEMRRSILNHQRAEDDIRSANSQLVTAMSHDLRTPLTSLLAYLEILDRDKAEDEQQRRHLIRQSLNKTITIKSMADKLFEYFLVYTSEWEQPEMETLSADGVFSQFWQEYAFSLESRGFTVETDFRELDGTVSINTELLRRAFDNLYANLLKYAEPEKPISMSYRREGENIVLELENVISSQRDRKESTNIGLNTCRRILGMHNGTFASSEEGDRFRVRITLPFA